MKMQALLIQTSTLADSPRLVKEVEVLEQNGYSVTILGWDRYGKTPIKNTRVKISAIQRTLRLNAPNGIGSLPFLLVWWCFELFWLINGKHDCIHAINFNSIIPAAIVGRLRGIPVIYEILDTQTDDELFPRAARNICLQSDKLIMRLVDAVIVVDEMQIEEFQGIPNSKVAVIYDSPPDLAREIEAYHKNDCFTAFYAGKLEKAKKLNLNSIFAAIDHIDNIRIVVAGYGDQAAEIDEWADRMPEKISFIGRVSYIEALKWSIESDLLFSIRDPNRPTHKYICGCKMLEAMMCGKPLIVSKGTSTARKVTEAECGLVVDPNDTDEIGRAIMTLMENREMCYRLGANGRKAYETTYSWGIMKDRLLNLYSRILDQGRGPYS